MAFKRRTGAGEATTDPLASTITRASSATGLAGARSGPSGQVRRDKTELDPELEGQIDRFVLDGPEVDPTDFALIRGPPHDITSTPQEITHDELKRICRLYRIPDSVGATVIGPGEDPARLPNEAVAVAERFFECGLTIPFPAFFQEMISEMVLAPGQLCPKFWRALSGCFVMWSEIGYSSFTFAKLAQCFYIKKCPVGDRPNMGFHYLSAYSKQFPLVTGNPSSDGPWQKRFFFLTGEWRNRDSPPIPRYFRRQPKVWTKENVPHTLDHIRHIKNALEIPTELRQADQLVRYSRLKEIQLSRSPNIQESFQNEVWYARDLLERMSLSWWSRTWGLWSVIAVTTQNHKLW